MIERYASVCAGEPVIAGTRITCWHLYALRCNLGWSTGRIVSEYPSISASDVEEAVAYILAHPEFRQEWCCSCGGDVLQGGSSWCASCGERLCWRCGVPQETTCRKRADKGGDA